jgi:hypothetical protein
VKARDLKKGVAIDLGRLGVKTVTSSAASVGAGWRLAFDAVTVLICRPDTEFKVVRLLDTFVECDRCRLLVWQGLQPETQGISIPGNHEPVECEGVALPSEIPICPGSEMLGRIVQEQPW